MTARQDIITILLDDKMAQLSTDKELAHHLLSKGFPGFENMSASQLRCMVCDAGLELLDGMGVLLHELSLEEPLVVPSTTVADLPLAPVDADPRLALAGEIRRYFQQEASPALVLVMLETLGPLGQTVKAENDFEGLNALDVAHLRRLVPVAFAQRERVRALLQTLEAEQ